MLGKKSKALLAVFIIMAILSLAAAYYKYMVLHDFYIENDLEEEVSQYSE